MPTIVPFESSHQADVVALLQRIHAEFNFTWEAAGYHRDVHDIETHYLQPGGMFWTLFDGDRVIGCTGLTIHGTTCELHRMYLDADNRGRGLGRLMLEAAMSHGRAKGCTRMEIWSDVVLHDAHRLYQRLGFTQEGERDCDDPDNSRELGFWKEPL